MKVLKTGYIGLIFASALLAGGPSQRSQLPVSFTADDACSATTGVIMNGAMDLTVSTDPTSTTPVSIKVSFRGDGNNNNAVAYTAAFKASALYSSADASYAVPFSAVLSTKGKGLDILVNGYVTVTLDDTGTATTAVVTTSSSSCM